VATSFPEYAGWMPGADGTDRRNKDTSGVAPTSGRRFSHFLPPRRRCRANFELESAVARGAECAGMRRLVLGIAVTTLLTFLGGAQAMDNHQDEQAIRKVVADFTEAWNKHDAHAFSMVFSEDADFTNVVGKGTKGRAEIEKFHAPGFATSFKNSHLESDGIRIRFIKPDVAAVDVVWEMTGAMGADGKPRPLRKGLLNVIMTKDNNSWLITVMHNMDLPAAPPK
jgi:uncharacterized protein (TIGR02246 family)